MTVSPAGEPLNSAGVESEFQRLDLRNCEDEPIRVPGSIQRHGFLLVLDESNRVVAASENVVEFLEVPVALVLGTPVATILEREVLSALQAVIDSAADAGLQVYLGSFQTRGKFFSVVTHRVGNERVLEFERLDRLVSPELTNQIFTNFVSKLSILRTEIELCQALTKQIKELTAFNRVLLYRFDEDGHGTVLSEENDGVLPSYLDLRFPASDIPAQARELYVLNTVRIIPDARYAASPLRGIGPRQMGGFDLSMSILRSVSPLHLEYMRNMGTLSSMSVSIVIEGKLWGLISAHHAEPRTVPYLVRSACDLLTKLICTQLMSSRASAGLMKMVQFHAVQRQILTLMAAENNYLSVLIEHLGDLVQITDADGAAFVLDGECVISGNAPAEADLLRLAEWMDGRPDVEVFESRHLASHIAWATEFSDVASGLIAIRISSVRQS
jgi:light-regulated signal transduction histidine kinase (bacteriophytochrome)